MLNKNLIEVKNQKPFIIEMMYAFPQNISGLPVYEQVGFGNRAFLHKDMWEKLQRLIPLLEKNNLRLKIKDAYRPPLAHMLLLKAVPVPGLFAVSPEASQHCHGTAVDVILCDENGNELEFQSPVDCYTPYFAKELKQGRDEEYKEFLKSACHGYAAISPAAKKNKEQLRQMMESVGLEVLPHEWWHYNLPGGKGEAYPLIDFQEKE